MKNYININIINSKNQFETNSKINMNSLTAREKKHESENNNNICNPIDLNCIFSKNPKAIKNFLSQISSHKKFTIRNVRNNKYYILSKQLDLSIELLIEKMNESFCLLRMIRKKGEKYECLRLSNYILYELNKYKYK